MRPQAWIEGALALAAAFTLAGCVAVAPREAPGGLDPARARTTRGQGFVVVDDGALQPRDSTELFRELVSSRAAILRILGRHVAPGDFRSYEERRSGQACAPAPQDVRVVVLRSGSRCHADETGVTIVCDHIARRDATHELVHYLAGAGWRPVDEGLAVYLTERICGPAGGVPIDTRTRVYLDLALEERLDRDRLKFGMSRRAYDLAGSFVKWLVETHGLDRFMELYRAVPGDYMVVYGEGELELEARWLASIRARDARHDGDYYRFRDHLQSLRGH